MKLFILLFAFLPALAFSQYCGSCRVAPKLLFSDLDVQVTKPTDANEISAWQLLSSVGKITRDYLSASNKDCVRFIDPVSAIGSSVDSKSLAAEAFCNKADYIITGNIRTSGDGYILHLDLQTACSKKTLTSSDQPFHSSTDTSYLRKIAEQAATSLNPLAEKINSYAINLRKQDRNIVLGGWGSDAISIEPKKDVLKPDEETEVEVTLRDCDGAPLPGRTISFLEETIGRVTVEGTTGGLVTPSQIVTDETGKAKVKFKMGKGKTAVIRPHVVCKKPSGASYVMRGARRMNELEFVSIDIMYFKDEATTADVSAFMPLLKGKTQRTIIQQDYLGSVDHIPEHPETGYLIISVPEKGQERSLYWDELGSYFYNEDKPEVRLDTKGGAIEVDEQISKYDVDQEKREISDKRHASIVFFTGKDDEPMRFELGLNFENETDIAEGNSLRGAASLSIDPKTTGAKFTMKKITDPKSMFKKEYIIEYINKDLGSMDEVNKLAGTNFKRLDDGIYYTGQEVLWVRIRSTY